MSGLLKTVESVLRKNAGRYFQKKHVGPVAEEICKKVLEIYSSDEEQQPVENKARTIETEKKSKAVVSQPQKQKKEKKQKDKNPSVVAYPWGPVSPGSQEQEVMPISVRRDE